MSAVPVLRPQTQTFFPGASWVDAFVEAGAGLGIPPLYLEWAGIFAVSAAIGRHLTSENVRGTTFGNLFVMMIGPPGNGKSETEDLLRPFLDGLRARTAAENVSVAALMDELKDGATKKIIAPFIYDYHSLTILSSEFAQTFPEYDVNLFAILSRWWDCPDPVKERKRHLKEPILIPKSHFSMFTGIQPGVLAHSFPAQAWNGGFLARTILLYWPQQIKILLRERGIAAPDKTKYKIPTETFDLLMKGLIAVSNQHGVLETDESFVEAYMDWRESGQEPHPRHPRLTYYNMRREHQLEKLALISAASRFSRTLTSHDYVVARSWLEGAEANIDEVFIELSSGDDMQLMNDLHAFIIRAAKGCNIPIRETLVRRYLTGRVSTQRMDSFMQVAEQAGFIKVQLQASGYRTVLALPSGDLG